jgi:hypothetical protein
MMRSDGPQVIWSASARRKGARLVLRKDNYTTVETVFVTASST